MTLSILLTSPWDPNADDTPPRLEVPKVRAHRFSWKGADTIGFPKDAWNVIPQRWGDNDDGGSTEDAEVIASSADEAMFRRLHGVIAKDADYDELAKSVRDDEYAGIVDVIKEMAAASGSNVARPKLERRPCGIRLTSVFPSLPRSETWRVRNARAWRTEPQPNLRMPFSEWLRVDTPISSLRSPRARSQITTPLALYMFVPGSVLRSPRSSAT
jgi:hypothetical protein